MLKFHGRRSELVQIVDCLLLSAIRLVLFLFGAFCTALRLVMLCQAFFSISISLRVLYHILLPCFQRTRFTFSFTVEFFVCNTLCFTKVELVIAISAVACSHFSFQGEILPCALEAVSLPLNDNFQFRFLFRCLSSCWGSSLSFWFYSDRFINILHVLHQSV